MPVSSGMLCVDPAVRDLPFNPGWIILRCCPELGRYWRMIYWSYFRERLQEPAWGSHLSVVRGENITKPLLTNQEIPFSYESKLWTDGLHYWLPAWSDELLALRKQLGLGLPPFPFHLTIGVSSRQR